MPSYNVLFSFKNHISFCVNIALVVTFRFLHYHILFWRLYYKGYKTYYYVHDSPGWSATKMELPFYRGKMGKLVDAGALLRAIAGSGSDMKVPNLYVGVGKTVKIDLKRYFLNGENLTYECSINDTSKAVATFEGTVMTVRGIVAGMTNATLKTSGGKEQSFTITVRNNANDNGWM